MAKTVDELIVKIRADMGQLKAQLRDLERSSAKTGKQGGQNLGAFAAGGALAANSTSKLIGRIGALGIALAGIQGVRGVAAVGSRFEDLKDSLDTVFGSVAAGDQAFNRILNFAQTTPFQIDTATQAFIALKSAGIEPTNDMLQTFADTSSVAVDQLGTFNALIRLVQRSAGGGLGLEELNMIADRGIDVFGGLKDELGLSRDEISEFGKSAEGAKTIVDALIRSLNKQFGGAMATKMDNLSTVSSNMEIAFRELGDEIFKSGIGDMMKGLAATMTDLANATSRFFRAVRGERTLQDLGITTEDPVQKLKEIDAEIKRLQKQSEEVSSKDFMMLHSSDAEGLMIAKILIENENQINTLLKERKALVDAENNETEKNNSLTQEQIGLRTQFKKILEDSVPEVERLNNLLKELNQFEGLTDKEGVLVFTKEEITQIENYINALIDAENQQDKTVSSAQAMADAIAIATNSFAMSFADALLNSGNMLESFRNLAADIVKQIIATFMQLAVINPILNSVFSGVEGYTPAPTMELAGGGRYSGGQPLLVGERGPELLIPNSGGTVLNNMNTKNALGGGGTTVVNQSINFATGINATVRNEVLQLLPQIADVTAAAVQEKAVRSIRYKGAFSA
tara:strand:- start:163 stop:2043 length:1881 start_codon:yes stop_codon:yes gene_type:complete